MKDQATITMSRPVLARLREVAKSEKRTLSQQLELLAERHFSTRRVSAATDSAGRSSTPRKPSKRKGAKAA